MDPDLTNWPAKFTPDNFQQATVLQRQLAAQVSLKDATTDSDFICGLDVSNDRFDPEDFLYAAAVLLDRKTLAIKQVATSFAKASLPYRTGFLAFREIPVLLQAYLQLKQKPAVILVDGHGISHPRRLGIASHLGVVLDQATIGVGKTLLVGKPQKAGDLNLGEETPLIYHNEQIGYLLQSKKRANPLIISPGHKISAETSLCFVKESLKGYRLPEPTRLAHIYANALRRNKGAPIS